MAGDPLPGPHWDKWGLAVDWQWRSTAAAGQGSRGTPPAMPRYLHLRANGSRSEVAAAHAAGTRLE